MTDLLPTRAPEFELRVRALLLTLLLHFAAALAIGRGSLFEAPAPRFEVATLELREIVVARSVQMRKPQARKEPKPAHQAAVPAHQAAVPPPAPVSPRAKPRAASTTPSVEAAKPPSAPAPPAPAPVVPAPVAPAPVVPAPVAPKPVFRAAVRAEVPPIRIEGPTGALPTPAGEPAEAFSVEGPRLTTAGIAPAERALRRTRPARSVGSGLSSPPASSPLGVPRPDVAPVPVAPVPVAPVPAAPVPVALAPAALPPAASRSAAGSASGATARGAERPAELPAIFDVLARPAPVAAERTAPRRILVQPLPELPKDHPLAGSGAVYSVKLAVAVAADGRVTGAKVVQSSGEDDLDARARAAVLAWRFAAGPEESRSVTVTYDLR